MFKDYAGLPKGIYILTMARFINACGFFVIPFLSLYLTQIMHISIAETGMYVGLTLAATLPGSILGGKLADHYGRKITLILGNVIAVICLVPATYADTPSQLTVFLMLFRFFQSCTQPVCDAIVADLAASDTRQAAYTLPYMGANLGCACGTLIGGLLFNSYPKLLFILNELGILGMVVIVAFGLPETLYRVKQKQHSDEIDEGSLPLAEKVSNLGILAVLWQRPQILLISFVLLLFDAAYSQCMFFLPLHLQQLFPGKGAEYFSLLMTINTVLCVFLTAPFVSVTKKMGALGSIMLSGLFYTVGLGLQGFIAVLWLFAVATVFWTTGEILLFANVGTYISNNSPASHRSRLNSISFTIAFLGFWIGPTLGGYISASSSASYVWITSSVISLLALSLIPLVKKLEVCSINTQ